jgi:peptidoglycan/LPS O-acetylase OafA/YrhL
MLRGFSVLLVLLFHLEIVGTENGFLGVDIFFVISGFLMAVLYNQTSTSDFFLRRAKRLLPAYFVTIVATVLAAAWLTLPAEFSAVGHQAAHASIMVSNVGYWLADSYFDKTVFKPLLHLWSIGVEIQFYLVIPIIAWLAHKWRASFLLILFGSLVLCFLTLGVSAKTAFFLAPFRLWEFMLGGLVAVLLSNHGAIRHHSLQWLGLIGLLVLLAIPFMGIEGDARSVLHGHPGVYSLTVCIGTVLILAFGLPKVLVNNLLSRAMEILGKYSYSIYLVHLPIIVLYFYEPFSGTILGTGSPIDLIKILSMTALASVALYHLIEKPARDSEWNIYTFAALPCMVILVMATGFGAQRAAYTPDEMRIFAALNDEDTFRCGRLLRMRDPLAMSCELTDGDANANGNILLVGNSHANMIKGMFAQVAQEMNYRVRFLVPNDPLMEGGSRPVEIIQEALRTNATALVLHYSPGAIEPKTVSRLVALAQEKQLPVRFITPVPVWGQHIPIALWRHLRFGDPLPSLDLREYKQANARLLNGLQKIKATNFAMADAGSVFCQSECEMQDETGVPFYLDDHHLTLTGSAKLTGLVRELIADLN